MKFKETLFKILFFLCAAFSILAVLLSGLFLFANGIPAMHKIGLTDPIITTKNSWKIPIGVFGLSTIGKFPFVL